MRSNLIPKRVVSQTPCIPLHSHGNLTSLSLDIPSVHAYYLVRRCCIWDRAVEDFRGDLVGTRWLMRDEKSVSPLFDKITEDLGIRKICGVYYLCTRRVVKWVFFFFFVNSIFPHKIVNAYLHTREKWFSGQSFSLLHFFVGFPFNQ